MKKLVLLLAATGALSTLQAQGLKGLLQKGQDAIKDSSTRAQVNTAVQQVVEKVTGQSGGLSSDEVINGLKEALSVGTNKGAARLSAVDGFFKDAAIKILMPAEAQKVESKLRGLGFGKQVDQAILSMNRAAEEATKQAAPIFLNAIKGITIQDGMSILRGDNQAATTYLKGKTQSALTEAFRPVIEQALAKVNATKYWNTLFTTYNRVSKDKVNPDLAAYVTEKSLSGIFYNVGQEEAKIRQDPAARTTELLKKVFGSKS
ncbi:DUF4197 domain-containing protein [Flaviaesturariibacter aridisoli]|uniref:DUF4197 domain-containing protein n=1 Tax=Flaviaesturariibacter aridisoli TaxID=2545761 RepID=A0A4R4DSM9_9BACT|nr:DUF4197 domain-containing protein [Flaviaesturariibacter aridisoli]TCZ65666.1 DUF4197 domain-containing protein [Flaviaesturariibacter aridisoli]